MQSLVSKLKTIFSDIKSLNKISNKSAAMKALRFTRAPSKTWTKKNS